MSKRIGIEFGSEITKVISSESGLLYNDYSVVCWNTKTLEIMMFGSDARKLIGKVEKPLKIVNPLIHGSIVDLEIFKEMATQIFDPISAELNDSEIVVALPVNENAHNTEAIRIILESYKPKSIRFEPRLILAAVGAGIDIEDEYGTIMLDISFSKALVGIVIDGKVVSQKESNYAEDEVNSEINKYFRDKLGMYVNNEIIEKVKYTIGGVIKLRDQLELNVVGRDIMTGEKKKTTVTDADFRKIFNNVFTSYKAMITSALESSPMYIRTGVVKNGLRISGGLSKIVGVKDFFQDFFDFPTRISKPAGNSVIEGTLRIK